MKRTPFFFITAWLLGSWGIAQDAAHPFDLMPGDSAPPLAVGQWLKGQPVDAFEPGQVYVVELWATWCGPCRKAIPHMTALQKQYADDVHFVGISIWERDQSQVPRFVDKMGDQMVYSVGMERLEEGEGRDRGVMARTWMEASGRWLDGIPSAFIVGRDGKVVWVGDPFTIDAPLEQVVNGSWDLAAYIQENSDAWQRKARAATPYRNFRQASQDEDWPKAVAALDELIELDAEEFSWAVGRKFRLLAAILNDSQAASEFGRKALETFAKDQPDTLNAIAWMIVSPEDNLKDKDLELALAAAVRANLLTENENPAFIDTLARVYFEKGDRAKAIEWQQKAIDMLDGEEREAYQKVLESYQADKT